MHLLSSEGIRKARRDFRRLFRGAGRARGDKLIQGLHCGRVNDF
jgi:hypothetical protein